LNDDVLNRLLEVPEINKSRRTTTPKVSTMDSSHFNTVPFSSPIDFHLNVTFFIWFTLHRIKQGQMQTSLGLNRFISFPFHSTHLFGFLDDANFSVLPLTNSSAWHVCFLLAWLLKICFDFCEESLCRE